ncbi:DUF433 domain-containing protein [Prosthecobacter sp.]|uniref:DUF433 domain-containing protein n=1 Tax=Prosthecobacter sp. TaxID=1965333 RepID=UPI0037830A63
MTTLNPTLLHELQSAPEPLQQEVLDFLLFIKQRHEAPPRGIEHTPGVCGGDACIASTRIPVWSLEQSRRLGFTEEELLGNYPTLQPGDLAAAWAYVKEHPVEIETAIRENEDA